MAGRFQYYSINSDSCSISRHSSAFFFLCSNISQSCQPILDSRFVSCSYSAPSVTFFFIILICPVLLLFCFFVLYFCESDVGFQLSSSILLPNGVLILACIPTVYFIYIEDLLFVFFLMNSNLDSSFLGFFFLVQLRSLLFVLGFFGLCLVGYICLFVFYPAIILFNYFWDFFLP